jgi:hypothetical protein
VKDAGQVKAGEEIRARVARGEIRAVVNNVTAEPDSASEIKS